MRTAPLAAEQDKASFARIAAPCGYFGTCGGCALQDLAYDDQLLLKRRRLERALATLGSVPPLSLVGLDEPWRYRNKAEFTFGESAGRLTLGYHAAHSFSRIVDLEDCLLLPAPATALARDALRLAAETGLPAYHPRTHQGFFRYLLVRASHATGRVLLCLMTTPGHRPEVERIAAALLARAGVASVYWGTTSRLADVAIPEELVLLGGEPLLEDRLGPFRLRVHPMSFLQPSSVQADRIYTAIAQAIGADAPKVVWDLYCGIGLVSFYLATHAGKVYGIDVEPHHLELAQANARLNGLDNLEFRAGQVEALLRDRRFWLQEAKPDAIVVDPPRAGLHPQALASILAARPPRIAYLSCNAQSLVRDLQGMCSGFPRYRIATIQSFDMFPQTNHVETLVVLER